MKKEKGMCSCDILSFVMFFSVFCFQHTKFATGEEVVKTMIEMTNFVSSKILRTFQVLETFGCTISSMEIEAQNSPLHNNTIFYNYVYNWISP